MGQLWKKRNILLIINLFISLGIKSNDTLIVNSTFYHSSVGKYTADGTMINNDSILKKVHRWIAISRDINLSFGDTVYIISEYCPGLNGNWIVKDRMGKSNRNKIDFLLHPTEIDSIRFYRPHKVKLIKKEGD